LLKPFGFANQIEEAIAEYQAGKIQKHDLIDA
jgi:hypothetical protein